MKSVILGDKNRFAVEFELNNDYGGVWMFGKMCLWIKEMQVGDYEMGVSLRDILILIESIVSDNENRVNKDLFELSAGELFIKLNDALYGDSSQFEEIALEETWARFNVNFTIDIFNNWKMFLVENQDKARLVFKNLCEDAHNGGVHQIELKKGEFDEVIYKAYEEMGRIFDIENEKSD